MEKKAENSIQKEYISEVECVNDSQASLADLRKTYLLSRHGTLDLDPLPHPDSTDPLNWPLWKVSKPQDSKRNASLNDPHAEKYQSGISIVSRTYDWIHDWRADSCIRRSS